ncbi:hypothetical protein PRUB_a5066 [Pseudoalteromonas rubra]|uniref:Uncharacterized protein n=1 Tax=Pseudoalteromonas rubra TaxID=43658 RepID=A0A8T0C3L9_9GAMM|nr:hypothetical protein [Pseudoalteromonas rubra]KAF7785284.1 hypothetical protein PRUB_a5066 [Pseudoalteromonas rubra]
MKAKHLLINFLCFMFGFLIAAMSLYQPSPESGAHAGSAERPAAKSAPHFETGIPFLSEIKERPKEQVKTTTAPTPNSGSMPRQASTDKAALLVIAQDIGLDSHVYPDLADYAIQDIARLIEQHLLTDFRISSADIYTQFDEIEHYLEEMPQLVSQYFFTDLMTQSQYKGELFQSLAIHLMAQNVEQFEASTEHLSQIQALIATASDSESELVRLSVLEALATMSSGKAQLRQVLSQFTEEESAVIQAKITLLNYHMSLADKLNID